MPACADDPLAVCLLCESFEIWIFGDFLCVLDCDSIGWVFLRVFPGVFCGRIVRFCLINVGWNGKMSCICHFSLACFYCYA